MSDDEGEVYAYSDDEGSDVDYAYGSDEDQDEQDHEIVNSYYEGEEFMQQNQLPEALEKMERVVGVAAERGGDDLRWCFKGLECIVMLLFKLGEHEKMLAAYERLLSYTSAVTRNESTDAINSVLDTISGATGSIVAQTYAKTLASTEGNERLHFTTMIRQAKAYLAQGDLKEVGRVIERLHQLCRNPDGSDDESKATYLMEVYALEISYCTHTCDMARMKEILPRTLKLNAAVSDPRIMGIIREEGGKLHMRQCQWSDAYSEFNEGFRAYQEAGNSRAKQCLKYAALSNILANSSINPFAATEAKVYQDDREVMAMMELRIAYDANDLPRFERTLEHKPNHILDDSFMAVYIEELRRRMREQVLLSITQPYSKMTLAHVAKELRLSREEIESLLVDLILDKRIKGQIDQIGGFVLLRPEGRSSSGKHAALARWADALQAGTGSGKCDEGDDGWAH
ncbi:cop9 signalosome complex subunit 2 [Nannochloropsis gaditana]|uniref:Cop9 signalosome complex subunit 2 n=1 Tax=Nannochloropsis gaditana TaxID=72520 RepID=W7U093_9STRA|nr:cop9 signalosome complex subunit 2 [Nannochloropsis gaditana]